MNPNNAPEEDTHFPQDTMPEELVDTPINYDEDAEDPLKRHAKFSWKSFGGDGFIVSIIFHAVLIIFALFYVVATIQPAAPEPQEFVSGSGGGSDGENANRQQHRMRQRPRDMATQNKITSKNARATLTLPEIPKVSSSLSAMSSMKAGGASSGTGGGAGGGIGTGIGVGIGNGSAFVSKFGTLGLNTGGISGRFYDLKQFTDGRDSPLAPKTGDAMQKYIEIGRNLVRLKGSWSASPLSRYFRAPTTLGAPDQIFIPGSPADEAPAAFGLKNKGQRWYIHYKGNIRANKTGKIRLVGAADDIICVRLGNALALDAGYDLMTGKEQQAGGPRVPKVLGIDTPLRPQLPGFGGIGMRTGPVIDIRAGATIPFECLIGETPGGVFSAVVLFEELDKSGAPVGKLKLFRFSAAPLTETIVEEIRRNPNWNAWNSRVDLSGGGWVFQPAKR